MNGHQHFILQGHETKEVDLLTWARWCAKGFQNRVVKQEQIGEVKVSTVFLGLNHNWGEGAPILFETMVFGGSLDQEQERYETWAQAEQGHAAMVEWVKQQEENHAKLASRRV